MISTRFSDVCFKRLLQILKNPQYVFHNFTRFRCIESEFHFFFCIFSITFAKKRFCSYVIRFLFAFNPFHHMLIHSVPPSIISPQATRSVGNTHSCIRCFAYSIAQYVYMTVAAALPPVNAQRALIMIFQGVPPAIVSRIVQGGGGGGGVTLPPFPPTHTRLFSNNPP